MQQDCIVNTKNNCNLQFGYIFELLTMLQFKRQLLSWLLGFPLGVFSGSFFIAFIFCPQKWFSINLNSRFFFVITFQEGATIGSLKTNETKIFAPLFLLPKKCFFQGKVTRIYTSLFCCQKFDFALF